MKTVVTICSANYLANAKVLGQSVKKHNPDCHFVIGLVDRLPKEIEPDYLRPFEVIAVEDLKIPDFQELVRKYNLIELNTLVKPFFLEYLYRRNPKVRTVMYLDPDIMVAGGFGGIEAELERSSLIITPHGCTYDDSPSNMYFERSMLLTGIYNLGFIATARSPVTDAFLSWWQERLRRFCFYLPKRGYFVDQNWVNLAPLYFEGVHIEKNPGCNMAYWNLFERTLSRKDGRYIVNDGHDLVFFHFSGYNPLQPDVISRRLHDLTFSERPDLRPLFDEYRDALLACNFLNLKDLPCFFAPNEKPKGFGRLPVFIKRPIKGALQKIFGALPNPLRRALCGIAQFTDENCRANSAC